MPEVVAYCIDDKSYHSKCFGKEEFNTVIYTKEECRCNFVPNKCTIHNTVGFNDELELMISKKLLPQKEFVLGRFLLKKETQEKFDSPITTYYPCSNILDFERNIHSCDKLIVAKIANRKLKNLLDDYKLNKNARILNKYLGVDENTSPFLVAEVLSKIQSEKVACQIRRCVVSIDEANKLEVEKNKNNEYERLILNLIEKVTDEDENTQNFKIIKSNKEKKEAISDFTKKASLTLSLVWADPKFYGEKEKYYIANFVDNIVIRRSKQTTNLAYYERYIITNNTQNLMLANALKNICIIVQIFCLFLGILLLPYCFFIAIGILNIIPVIVYHSYIICEILDEALSRKEALNYRSSTIAYKRDTDLNVKTKARAYILFGIII